VLLKIFVVRLILHIVVYYTIYLNNYVPADEPDTSSVSAYWEEDDTISAAINTSSEVYVIEVSIH